MSGGVWFRLVPPFVSIPLVAIAFLANQSVQNTNNKHQSNVHYRVPLQFRWSALREPVGLRLEP